MKYYEDFKLYAQVENDKRFASVEIGEAVAEDASKDVAVIEQFWQEEVLEKWSQSSMKAELLEDLLEFERDIDNELNLMPDVEGMVFCQPSNIFVNPLTLETTLTLLKTHL